jgi:DNA-binding MltR family transcriptional regulator
MAEDTRDMAKPKKEFDLIDESDRGAAIVGAALLEDDLVSMLKKNMLLDTMSQKQVKDIFDLSGPLSNFSAKISISLAFGFIDKTTFNDLQIVRKLRNKFAHSSGHLSFDDAEVKAQMGNMHCYKCAVERYPRRFSPSAEGEINEWEMRADGYIRLNKAAFSMAVRYLSMRIQYSSMVRSMKRSGIALPESFSHFKDIYDS